MGQCIIYERPDGGMSVIRPVGDVSAESQVKFVPKGAVYEIVDEDDLPKDRLFRDAWKKNGKTVETDLDAAKEQAHNWRRAKREEEFAPLDKEITINIKAQAKVDQIESHRQAVRDKYDLIQTEIDASADEIGLRSVLATREISNQ